MPAAFLRMIIEERCPSVRWSVGPSVRRSVGPSVREKRGVARIFCWGGGSALRVLNQLFDIWLFFISLFLSPCNVFLFCFFGDFFPLFRFRGRPLATYYLYLRYFDILLWMGRGIGRFCLWGESGRIFIIYGLFLLFILFSTCKLF